MITYVDVIVVLTLESLVTLSIEYTFINTVVGIALFVGWFEEY